MRNFLAIVLALFLGFIGSFFLSYVPRGLTAKEDAGIERVADMTFLELNDSKAVKAEGIRMEIMVPDLATLSIPKNKPGSTAPVKLSVRITNNTSTPLPFSIYGSLIPELVGSDGQALQRREPIDTQFETRKYDCSLVMSGKEIVVSLDARLSWRDNLLQLEVPTSPDYWQIPLRPDNSWSFNALQPGPYQLRFTYDSPSGEVLCLDPETGQERRVEGISTGRLATPFVNIRLVQPVEPDGNAVEVDGIRFETVVPERVLTVPKKRRSAETSVQIGIRITNNTPTPIRFSFYGTFIPDLVKPDGEVLRGGYNRNLVIEPKESDLLLAMPGDSVTFFPDITLSYSKRDQFLLVVSSGNGGFCPFGNLKPGTYNIRFSYQKLGSPMERTARGWEPIESRLLEKVWSGRVDTPFLEFRIVQP